MFDGIRKIFFKEKKAEELVLEFDELKKYFYENIAVGEKRFLGDIDIIKIEVISAMKDMISGINRLKEKEIVESRAKSSKAIKDRFCDKTNSVIMSALSEAEGMPMDDFKKTEQFYNFLKKALGKIDLSPKEVMHIRFFFTEDFSEILRKMTTINKRLDDINNILNSDLIVRKRGIEESFALIEKQRKNIDEYEVVIEDISKELEQLEQRKGSIRFDDVSEFSDIRNDIKHTGTRISYLKQQISSEFGGLSKILKKIYHEEKDTFILEYINTPFEAFMRDRENKIRSVLIKILVMIKDRRVDAEKRTVNKLEMLIGQIDELNQYRIEIEQLEDKMNSMKEVECSLSEKELMNRRNEKEIKGLDTLIADCMHKGDAIKRDISNAKTAIENEKAKTAELISSMFGKRMLLKND